MALSAFCTLESSFSFAVHAIALIAVVSGLALFVGLRLCESLLFAFILSAVAPCDARCCITGWALRHLSQKDEHRSRLRTNFHLDCKVDANLRIFSHSRSLLFLNRCRCTHLSHSVVHGRVATPPSTIDDRSPLISGSRPVPICADL